MDRLLIPNHGPSSNQTRHHYTIPAVTATMELQAPNWLWLILSLGGVGALLDFLIGKAGQQRTKDWLAAWWIRFDDVRWNNFGREEAEFSLSLIDRWCGTKLLSFRRLVFVVSLLCMLVVTAYGLMSAIRGAITLRSSIGFPTSILMLFGTILSLAVSLSITRKISSVFLHLVGDGYWRNLTVSITFLVFTCVLTSIWAPVVHLINAAFLQWCVFVIDLLGSKLPAPLLLSMLEQMTLQWFGRLLEALYQTLFSGRLIGEEIRLIWNGGDDSPLPADYALTVGMICSGYVGNLLRFLLGAAFLGSFLARPFLMRPVSLVWRRVVESDKPVFTLIFGGMGGVATAINEILKHIG